MIHTVKGFVIANEAEVDVFLEFSCFFYDPTKFLTYKVSAEKSAADSLMRVPLHKTSCFSLSAFKILHF